MLIIVYLFNVYRYKVGNVDFRGLSILNMCSQWCYCCVYGVSFVIRKYFGFTFQMKKEKHSIDSVYLRRLITRVTKLNKWCAPVVVE